MKAFDGDAGYGHTASGTINQVMKTGTNNLHGSAYWFSQPSALAANSFFNNRAGIPPAETKLNQYGFTAGGPVYVPKVYSGKNKLFWFVAFERLSDSQPNTKLLTVPTAAERNGDFSDLLKLGSSFQIYNPQWSFFLRIWRHRLRQADGVSGIRARRTRSTLLTTRSTALQDPERTPRAAIPIPISRPIVRH